MSEQNFKDRTLFIEDNLNVLRGMNSETVDLIYLDPPFNSKREYKAPIGTRAEGQKFDDTWRWDDLDQRWLGEIDRRCPPLSAVIKAARHTQNDGTAAYLAFMGIRLLELHRVLKPTGSIYLHCDDTANSYLRLAMDAVWGHKQFQNAVVWWYGGGGASKRHWGRKHDTLLFYKKTAQAGFNVDAVREEYKWRGGQKRADGSARDLRQGKLPDDVFHFHALLPWAKESTGWATQKPLKLLQRIIKASSNPGDLVLDPFAGCATCLVAAEMEDRQWVGIEFCEAANDILRCRLDEADIGALGSEAASSGKINVTKRLPKRTDRNGDELKPNTRDYKKRANRDRLYGEQRGDCNGCGNHYAYKDFHVDHIHPQAMGGSHDIGNLQLLCGHCNSTKGDGTMADLKERLAKQDADAEAKRKRVGL